MDFCYTFEKKVKDYIRKNRMAEYGSHLVVGVSGGADSMCLLELLRRFSREEAWKMTAVHVHHGIRGSQADEDERFVEAFCREREIDFESRHYNVPLEAKKAKEGEEEAGRRLRYQAFDEVLKEKGADKIVLAHHMDDQAETILFHLIRGSSLSGLVGMKPMSGEKIRPLLCVRKREIFRYLSERGIPYRTDQSNFSKQYARNRLRLSVLPVLEEINGGAVKNIYRAGTQLLETQEYLNGQTRQAAVRLGVVSKEGVWERLPVFLDKKAYEEEDEFIRKRVLYELLSVLCGGKKDLQEKHILDMDELFWKQEGKEIQLPHGLLAKADKGGVSLEERKEKKREEENGWEQPLFLEKEVIEKDSQLTEKSGCVRLEKAGKLIEWRLFLNESGAFFEKKEEIPKKNYTKWFDYDKISSAALFRTRRTGDWFVLDSSGKRKKLKQYFIDEKIPKQERDAIPLFADQSHIIWIIGGRISEEYKVREETRVILELRIVKATGGE